MESKSIGVIIIVAVIAGGGGYWFGSKSASATQSNGAGQFQGRAAGAGRTGGRFGGAGSAFGTVIAKDATSITVQLMTGRNASSTNGTSSGSKIVLYDASTEIGKTVVGSIDDVVVGQGVVVNGSANTDGSITAQMIQIRPAGPAGRGQ